MEMKKTILVALSAIVATCLFLAFPGGNALAQDATDIKNGAFFPVVENESLLLFMDGHTKPLKGNNQLTVLQTGSPRPVCP
jgi:hypothetical protein